MKINQKYPLTSQSLTNNLAIGDIISLGWRLYRLNFKQVITLNLIPTTIFAISNLLVNAINIFTGKPELMTIGCCMYPVGLILFFVGIFIAIICNYSIFKTFYNSLISEDMSIKELMQYTKDNISQVLILAGVISAEAVAFFIIDIPIYIILVFILVIPMILIGMVGHDNQYIGCLACFVSAGFFGLGLALFMALMSLQFIVCLIQIVIVTSEKINILDAVLKGYVFVYRNILKVLGFGFLASTVFYVLWLFFYFQSFALVMMILLPFGFSLDNPMSSGVLIVLLSIFNSLIGMLLWPYYASSITLFYYDMKTRTEGHDLFLILEEEKASYYRNRQIAQQA